MKSVFVLLFLFPALVQAGDFTPVCQRTNQVRVALEQLTSKTCDLIQAADLAPITRVSVANTGITALQSGDFTGLPNLQILNIRGNPFTTLPEGLLDDLPNLQTLVLFRGGLTTVPNDFLAHNPLIENLYLFGDPLASFPQEVLDRFKSYQHWASLELDKKVDDASGGQVSQIFNQKTGVNLVLD